MADINLYENNPGYFNLYLDASEGSVGDSTSVFYNVKLKVKVQKKPNYSGSISATYLGFMICKSTSSVPGAAIGTGYKVPVKNGSATWSGGTLTVGGTFECNWTNITFTEAINASNTYYLYLLYGDNVNKYTTGNAIMVTGQEILSGTITVSVNNLVVYNWTNHGNTISTSPEQQNLDS